MRVTPTHHLPRPRGGHCPWRQEAPGLGGRHVPPTCGARDRGTSFLGSWPALGLCRSPRPPQKGNSSSIQTHGRPAACADPWLRAPGAGCLDDFPVCPGPTHPSHGWDGEQGRPEGSGERSAWGVSPRALSVGLCPRARHHPEVLAGSWRVTRGPCVATTSGKVTSSPSSLSQAEVWRGSRRFLQLRNPPAWSRTPTGVGASQGLKWCTAVNRSMSECTRVGTCVPCLSGVRES